MSVGKYKNGRYIKMASIGGSDKIDSALSNTSTNPVQNKVITTALNNKANSGDLSTLTEDYSYFKVLTQQTLYGSSNLDGFTQNISEINSLLEDSAPYNRVPLKLTSESTATLDEENRLFFEPSQVAIFETLSEFGADIAVEFACDFSDVDWEHTSIKCRVVNDESSQEWRDLSYNSRAEAWYCRYMANGIGRVQIKIETTSELDTVGYDNCFYRIIPFVANLYSIGFNNVPVKLKGTEGTFPKYDFYYSNKELTNKVDNLSNLANPDIYSTTEKVVGEWIDGKPLYQITIDCGYAPNNDQKDVPLPALNYETIWIQEGFMINLNTLASLPANLARPDDNELAMGCYTTSLGTIRIMTRTNRSEFKCYVTLRYTKTTD